MSNTQILAGWFCASVAMVAVCAMLSRPGKPVQTEETCIVTVTDTETWRIHWMHVQRPGKDLAFDGEDTVWFETHSTIDSAFDHGLGDNAAAAFECSKPHRALKPTSVLLAYAQSGGCRLTPHDTHRALLHTHDWQPSDPPPPDRSTYRPNQPE